MDNAISEIDRAIDESVFRTFLGLGSLETDSHSAPPEL